MAYLSPNPKLTGTEVQFDCDCVAPCRIDIISIGWPTIRYHLSGLSTIIGEVYVPKLAYHVCLSLPPALSSAGQRCERRLPNQIFADGQQQQRSSDRRSKSRPACPLSICSYGISSTTRPGRTRRVRRDLRVHRDRGSPGPAEATGAQVKRDPRARLGLREPQGAAGTDSGRHRVPVQREWPRSIQVTHFFHLHVPRPQAIYFD